MISVIIPALNEEATLQATLDSIAANQEDHEVIVVDAGSGDKTPEIACGAGARLLVSPRRHRAAQMNFGAKEAKGEILFFLHADTRIAPSALGRIAQALGPGGAAGGGFLRYFDSRSLFLKLTCWIAGIRCRVSGLFLGDQGIFVRADIFRKIGGFNEFDLFEDVDLCRRLKEVGRIVTLGPPAISSARRFEAGGVVKTTLSDLNLSLRYIRGADPNQLADELKRPAVSLSVVIPAVNEEKNLLALLDQVVPHAEEVIVVDGGSTDSTVEIARARGALVIKSERGRALQMNRGAAQAGGKVIWFLHADSKLSAGWKGQMLRALEDPAVVGGGFNSRIEAPGPGYRFLDGWGWLRARAQRSLYGDQGIFVRREVFRKLGGFPDWPVFEDVDFSSRLFRAGKIKILPGPLKTSARRWQGQGWWRTVLQHSSLAWTQQFDPRFSSPVHLIVVAKAPEPGKVKTRLIPAVGPDKAARIAEKLLIDMTESALRIKGVLPSVSVSPTEGFPLVRRLVGDKIRLIPQPSGNLGARLSSLSEAALRLGAKGVIIVGADHPNLPREFLERAAAFLRRKGDRVVLGPTEDGGYYLVGMNRFHPEIFEGIHWSTSTVFEETLAAARRIGVPVEKLPSWYDLDRPEDLARLPLTT